MEAAGGTEVLLRIYIGQVQGFRLTQLCKRVAVIE
jgi:hypothetical protein